MNPGQALVLYTHGLGDCGSKLEGALREQGADIRVAACDSLSRDDLRAAFVEASVDAGMAVIAFAPNDRGPARPLLEWDSADWQRCADEPQIRLLEVLQALRKALNGRPCAVVLLGASIGMTGAALHTALATATEGQRGLMKALARQWGDSWRINWVSVTTPLLFPEIGYDDIPEQCELGAYTPSLGRRPGWIDVARTVLMLGGSNSAGVTGQTVIVDGGEWMLP